MPVVADTATASSSECSCESGNEVNNNLHFVFSK